MTTENILNEILQAILACGYLDVKFISDLISEYELNIFTAIERLEQDSINCNSLIYELLVQKAEKFIEQYGEIIYKRGLDTEQVLEDIKNTIYSEYMDSGFYYQNEKIQDLLNEFGI